jgi:Flp pilus assembly protein TadG
MLMAYRRSRRQRGQALPEFALVAPIFFLLVFGVIQVGLLMATQNGLVNGVRDSARRAATYRVNDQSFDGGVTFSAVCDAVEIELTNRLRKEIPGFVPTGRLTNTTEYKWVANPTSGEYSLIARVVATYTAPIYVPLVGLVLHPSDPGNFPLSASEEMRVENPALTPADTSTQTC